MTRTTTWDGRREAAAVEPAAGPLAGPVGRAATGPDVPRHATQVSRASALRVERTRRRSWRGRGVPGTASRIPGRGREMSGTGGEIVNLGDAPPGDRCLWLS